MKEETRERSEKLEVLYSPAFRRLFEIMKLGTTDSPVFDDVLLDLANRAGIDETSDVLEPCSGSGGVSRLLAKNTGCRVFGLDLVDYQLKVSRKLAEEEGLEKRISYQKGDAAAFDYPAETYDVVVDVFAWVHVSDWPALMKRLRAALKPEGRLMMYDAFVTQKTTEETLATVREKWFDPGITTFEEFQDVLTEAGFKMTFKKDRRKQVLTNWRLGLERFKEHQKKFSVKFGEDVFHLFYETIQWTIDAHEREELGAYLLIAEKTD